MQWSAGLESGPMLRNSFWAAAHTRVAGSVRSAVTLRPWGLALVLVAASAQAQQEPLASMSACSSARAVHDTGCPNYTGFQPERIEGSDEAAVAAERPERSRTGLYLPEGPARGLSVGRKLPSGVASWYGPGFHGRLTANGERFNQNELTAAHKTLPFGTRVLVENPRTGKQVVVRINDRGPYAKGRVIDLSKAAAQALGMIQRGHDQVVLREVVPASKS